MHATPATSQAVPACGCSPCAEHCCACAQHLPPALCTLNLHLAQRLGQQARARGPIAHDSEWWVERGCGSAKTPTKGRVSRAPEATIVRQLLDSVALAELSARRDMLSFDGVIPSYRSLPLTGPGYDARSAATGSQLLHKGRKVTALALDTALTSARQFIVEEQPKGWAAADATASSLLLYTAALRAGTDVVHSTRHSRASRVSHYVTVARTAQRTHRLMTCLAEVQHFLRVAPPAAGMEPLRLAICRVFSEQQQVEGMLVGC